MVLYGKDVLLYEVVDSVAVITMNRPERRNALSTELHERLAEVLAQFDEDDSARVAILTGKGDKAFSAGGDLKEFAERGLKNIQDANKPGARTRYPSATYSWEVSKPVIAAVNGFALAGGFMIALRCDLRVASETAEFGITEPLVGRAAPWAVPLLWSMPAAAGLELMLTGSRISAQRAYELGFVNRVVPQDQLLDSAMELAQSIVRNAPLTVRAHKELFYRAMDVGRAVGFQIADELCRPVYESEDCQEGQRAFAQKRPPEWQGR
jgi:enoyl-CoA hydratase/carnithine racemase